MSELNFTHSNGNKVKLATPDTLAADKTFKLPGADGSGGQVLQTDGSGALSFASNLTGIQNMVNNGGMTVSQRYGTSENTPSNNGHTLDQMRYDLSQSGKFKVQQVTDAPAGFSHSMKVTSLSSYTSGANDYFLLQTFIEGTDSARLGWGTSDAQTVTLSFYVKSSITGVHACGIRNQNYTRANTQTYTINNANTWERKTVTFTGDTSGTWLTSTNSGLKINFDLGSGSNFVAASTGAWLGTNDFITSNSVKFVANNAATWYITGIQLQVGEIATPFEHRSITDELRHCQRYFAIFPGRSGGIPFWQGYMGASYGYCSIPIPNFNMRAVPIPTDATTGTSSSTGNLYDADGNNINSRFAGNGTVTLSCGGYAPSGLGLIMNFGNHQSGSKNGVSASWNGASPGIFLSAEMT